MLRRRCDLGQGPREVSLLRVCVASTISALVALIAAAALMRLSVWVLAAGPVVAVEASYVYATRWRGRSACDPLLAVTWTLASYVILLVAAFAASAVAYGGGGLK
jgi:hypothetical protein